MVVKQMDHEKSSHMKVKLKEYSTWKFHSINTSIPLKELSKWLQNEWKIDKVYPSNSPRVILWCHVKYTSLYVTNTKLSFIFGKNRKLEVTHGSGQWENSQISTDWKVMVNNDFGGKQS